MRNKKVVTITLSYDDEDNVSFGAKAKNGSINLAEPADSIDAVLKAFVAILVEASDGGATLSVKKRGGGA